MTQRRILIVHDDADVTGELETRLVRLGFEVAAVAPPGDRVRAAASAAPALVLADAALRGAMDGVALDAIRGTRAVPVVFVGSAADEEALQSAAVDGSPLCVVLPCTDRELRVTIELALCRRDTAAVVHELEDFFDLSVDMLCFLGFDGHFRRLNPAWERTLGFTRAELMARPFIEFVHPDDRARTLAQNAAVRGGGQALGFENRYLCRDGSYRWFFWNAAPHSAGRVIYSVARDVTERRQAEAERAELMRQLETSLAEVRTLKAILPICSYCRKIRDDANSWDTVESYIARHTASQFSHGICPACMSDVVEPELAAFEDGTTPRGDA